MTISQIVSLVESCSPEELAFMEDGARMNSALADYGMQHKLGIGAASSLAKYCRTDIMGNSLMSRIMTLMASSAEGRMCGLSLCSHEQRRQRQPRALPPYCL